MLVLHLIRAQKYKAHRLNSAVLMKSLQLHLHRISHHNRDKRKTRSEAVASRIHGAACLYIASLYCVMLGSDYTAFLSFWTDTTVCLTTWLNNNHALTESVTDVVKLWKNQHNLTHLRKSWPATNTGKTFEYFWVKMWWNFTQEREVINPSKGILIFDF